MTNSYLENSVAYPIAVVTSSINATTVSTERAMGTSLSCSAAPAQAEKLCLLLLPGQVLQT